MLKSYGVEWAVGYVVSEQLAMWWVAHVILVSAQGQNPSFFFFCGTFIQLGTCLDKGLDSDLDQGLTTFTDLRQTDLYRAFGQTNKCIVNYVMI